MFGLSFEKLFVLAVIGLFVLGPERLPAAAAWLGQTLRKVRSFADGANQQLRNELGGEFDELREPLSQLRAPLQELRSLRDPRSAIMRHLLAEQPADTTPAPVPPVTVRPRPAPAPTSATATATATGAVAAFDPEAT